MESCRFGKLSSRRVQPNTLVSEKSHPEACNAAEKRLPISAGPASYRILGENLKALLRLKDNSAKLDCSLNTAPIPDFFPETAMQRHTFLRTRTKKRIRILPRVPTLQTYSFWAIGVIQRRWLARYCSIPAFFCTDGTAASTMVAYTKKKLGPDPV